MPATFRSSTTITSWSRTSRVLARWRKSARDARTFRCARATLALALARFAEPLPAAGEPPLVAGESLSPAGQLLRVRDLLPIRGDREVLDAEVHARQQRPVAGSCSRASDLDGEGDVPAPARITGDGHRGRVDRRRVNVRPGPHELQWRAHLREPQRAVPVPEPRPGVLGGLPAVAGLEARVAGTLGEEIGVGDLLVPDRLLKRDRRTPRSATPVLRWPSWQSGRRWPA